MARRAKTREHHPLKAAKSAISRTAKKIGKRLRPARRKPQAAAAASRTPKPAMKKRAPAKAARPARREADIPLDVLERTYTPRQTSLKASFRASGEERQRDQELASGYVETRWNDEDRLTNRSGDPRIGTHRRKYEPGE
jgi:hypothetical protein